MTARIEKTVFISYRRTNLPWALAIYQELTHHGYDVFFDYLSIPSGDFENIIVENIKARAHFVVILTPSALERCNEPGDWLRREIETAMDEKRNIIPLMLESFDFGSPSTTKALSGKLKKLKKYNGLRVHSEYFFEGMNRLRTQFLNVSLDTVVHPISESSKPVTEEHRAAASEAAQVEKEQLNAQTWFESGYVSQNNNNLEDALRCYSEAIRLDPTFSAAYYNSGDILSNLKRNDEAETAYSQAIELNPLDERAYYILKKFVEAPEHQSEIEATYSKLIEHNLINNKFYLVQGMLLRNWKRFEEAEIAFQEAIALNPFYAEAYFELGNLLDEWKRYDEAEIAFRKAIELNPPYDKAYSRLGNLLFTLTRYDEAEVAFRKAIELNSSCSTAYFGLGGLYTNWERYEEAEAFCRKAIELNSPSPTNYFLLGYTIEQQNRYEEAEIFYRKAIELDSSFVKAYIYLGILLYANLKHYNEAEVALLKAIQLNPLHENIHKSYYVLTLINKQLGKSIPAEYLAKARRFLQENDWYNRACFESVLNNFDLAFEHLERATQSDNFDAAWAWNDPDLQWIRDDPRFTKIVGAKPE